MLEIEYSGQFKRDVKLAEKRGKNLDKLKEVINLLIHEGVIPEKNKEHALTGNWKNYRDLHIEPDWLLLYIKTNTAIRFERTGTHADIFG